MAATTKAKKPTGADIIKRRHPEWCEHQRRWRFLADSLEGGDRYKHADYVLDPTAPAGQSLGAFTGLGWDAATGEAKTLQFGRVTQRNLIPHVSEMTQDGGTTYALRLARTPAPSTVERCVGRHLSRIYSQEIRREATGSKPLEAWWADVDGAGTNVNTWMRQTVAPLLLVLGQLDLAFDHPAPPDGLDPDAIETKADQVLAGVDRCVASIVLPENMVWWRLNPDRTYSECLVLERCDESGDVRWRHWTALGSTLYDCKGNTIDAVPHQFGRVPIVRVFDRRLPRCRNVGHSRYGGIADLQKAIYNGRSELILGDVLQAHPILQGDAQAISDGSISTGPDHILPIPRSADGAPIPWSFVEPPKGAADALRTHVMDFGEEADRDAALTKPAGTNSTVAQSGVAKALDSQEGGALLGEIAGSLADAERVAARMALVVLNDGDDSGIDTVEIEYPTEFGLLSANDLAAVLTDIQAIAASMGKLPLTEAAILNRLVSIVLAGADDKTLDAIEDEIDKAAESAASTLDGEAEAAKRAAKAMNDRGNQTGTGAPGGDSTDSGDAEIPQAGGSESDQEVD